MVLPTQTHQKAATTNRPTRQSMNGMDIGLVSIFESFVLPHLKILGPETLHVRRLPTKTNWVRARAGSTSEDSKGSRNGSGR